MSGTRILALGWFPRRKRFGVGCTTERPASLDDLVALASSIDDLDGTFSFLVSTEDEIGYAKDRLAAKPMIMYEDDDLVAIASEEVSLNRLFPGQALNTREQL